MEKARTFFKDHQKFSMSIGAVLLLLTGAGAVYGFEQYQQSQSAEGQAKRQFEVAKKEIKDTVDIASGQVDLPKDEEAVLATVADREKLMKQKFFQKAQDGDQLLMYPKHKKVYLYRPSTKKVIAYSKLEFGDPTPTPTPTPVGGDVAGDATGSGKILIQTEK